MRFGFLWYLQRFAKGTSRLYGSCVALDLESANSQLSFRFWVHFVKMLELDAADSKVFAKPVSNLQFSMVDVKPE